MIKCSFTVKYLSESLVGFYVTHTKITAAPFGPFVSFWRHLVDRFSHLSVTLLSRQQLCFHFPGHRFVPQHMTDNKLKCRKTKCLFAVTTRWNRGDVWVVINLSDTPTRSTATPQLSNSSTQQVTRNKWIFVTLHIKSNDRSLEQTVSVCNVSDSNINQWTWCPSGFHDFVLFKIQHK